MARAASSLGWALVLSTCAAFLAPRLPVLSSSNFGQVRTTQERGLGLVVRSTDDNYEPPSDSAYDAEDDLEATEVIYEAPQGPASAMDVPSDVGDASDGTAFSSEDCATLERELLKLCASTSRGAVASQSERMEIDALCRDLEDSQELPFDAPMDVDGVWNLVYSSEPGLYRQSPFFWGFSQLLDGKTAPFQLKGSRDQGLAENVYSVTDAIPFYKVGRATQTISGASTGFGTLISEVELSIQLFDVLVPAAKSVMTTTARCAQVNQGLSLTLETTEVKDSTISKLPGLGFLNDLAFPTESAFDQLSDLIGAAPNSATVDCTIPYLSNGLRITRTPSGYVFVHSREP